ncbi:transmembrane protein 174 [Pagrus major]|uniref:transmembrane protein 174 n=1 Tax=Pagrus major TaxID=143350 RepID=UPI003CC89124
MDQLAPAPQTFVSNTVVESPDTLLDRVKFGAALFFTGLFVELVGVIFTVTGWEHYRTNPIFKWTQVLGPILISIGGTFIVTSVCKFGNSCWPFTQRDEEVPVMEETSTGHTFTLSCINQQVMFSGTTTMLCVQPVYNFTNQEVRQTFDFQPGRSVSLAAVPSYESVCCVDNAAFTAEEESSTHNTGTDHRTSRTERTEEERQRDDDSGSTRSRPPAYEDIYPSSNEHSWT